jgi:hypothetical protein
MSGEYVNFNELVKRAVIRIDSKQKTASPGYLQFRENMKTLFSDDQMFSERLQDKEWAR